jgi:hypothetical protein
VRRELRHDDGGADIAEPRMPRHRLCVIAGGHRDHTALAFGVAEQCQPIGRATLLERTGDLQILELQHHIGAGCARYRFAGERRRSQHAADDALGRRRHVGEAQHVSRT